MPGESSDNKDYFEEPQFSQTSDSNQVRSLGSHYVAFFFRGETESSEVSDEYTSEFNSIGIEAVRIPVLSFEYVNIDSLMVHVQNHDEISGLLFTSPRCVFAVEKALLGCSNQDSIRKSLRQKFMFCVGTKTAEMLRKHLQFDSSLGEEQSKTGSSQDLANYIVENFKNRLKLPLLLPCSTLADGKLPEILKRHDIHTIVLHVYKTCPEPSVSEYVMKHQRLFEQKEAIYVFFSPSGVNTVLSSLSTDVCNDPKYVAIGKTTAEHLRKCNRDVWCIAEKPNAKSLKDSVYQRLRNKTQN
ncbi:uroporphyrinogen-III synthase-like protein [Leptotrombidium deliense]|uniref:Uroporphyrinogen-III synthase n=1 Tax=Leptotrombidium deliense TaxID=299467 RepID=A0A443S4S1_9ACAR|nr:uroporphyrinogen-III synthase-like protein [Leptotrombidium deliense]